MCKNVTWGTLVTGWKWKCNRGGGGGGGAVIVGQAYIDGTCVTTISSIFTESVQAYQNQRYFKFFWSFWLELNHQHIPEQTEFHLNVKMTSQLVSSLCYIHLFGPSILYRFCEVVEDGIRALLLASLLVSVYVFVWIHYLNRRWNVVNSNLGNTLQWNIR